MIINKNAFPALVGIHLPIQIHVLDIETKIYPPYCTVDSWRHPGWSSVWDY
jgi:hypothetical protein